MIVVILILLQALRLGFSNGFVDSVFDSWIWQTNLTIFEGREGTEFSDGDVLIFPEMIKYR